MNKQAPERPKIFTQFDIIWDAHQRAKKRSTEKLNKSVKGKS